MAGGGGNSVAMSPLGDRWSQRRKKAGRASGSSSLHQLPGTRRTSPKAARTDLCSNPAPVTGQLCGLREAVQLSQRQFLCKTEVNPPRRQRWCTILGKAAGFGPGS